MTKTFQLGNNTIGGNDPVTLGIEVRTAPTSFAISFSRLHPTVVFRADAEVDYVQSRQQRVLVMHGFFDEGRQAHFLIELAPEGGVYRIPGGHFDVTGLPLWTVEKIALPIHLRVDTRLRRSRILRRILRRARRGQHASACEGLRAYVQRRSETP